MGCVLLCGSLALLFSLSTKANAQTASYQQIRINHFIYIIQENHSFDNYFGTYAKADHIPPGIKLADGLPIGGVQEHIIACFIFREMPSRMT